MYVCVAFANSGGHTTTWASRWEIKEGNGWPAEVCQLQTALQPLYQPQLHSHGTPLQCT